MSRSQTARSYRIVTQKLTFALMAMGSIFLLAGVGVLTWFSQEDRMPAILQQLRVLAIDQPLWLEIPVTIGQYLRQPFVLILLFLLGVMRLSPAPRPWSRLVVGFVMLGLTIRYLLWRVFETLNFADPLNRAFSIGILALELLALTTQMIQLVLVSRATNRSKEADMRAIAVEEGSYCPSVDVMVPTYDEPTFILKRTIMGCQAMNYRNKTVYLLDDTRRPEMKALAAELGCEYMTRPDNTHAKAGNLNHALQRTSGELITVFDADFVPTKNFLDRTIGFFRDRSIGLVQTHQSFFNPDPVARNIGLENIMPPEVEIFSRYYQPLRDGVETALCYGSSFVTRRSALDETGGFMTGSLSEDYFTGIRLASEGKRVIFLGESLSAGLSAENMSGHITQRLRWARGTLQAFFIDANPLKVKGLSFIQRIAHLDGLLQWFTSVTRVVLLLTPLAYAFLGVIPWRATPTEMMSFFIPYYAAQLFTFSWLSERSRSALISDVYSVAQCFPVAVTVLHTLINPFSTGFKVTPKGVSSDRFNFNFKLALPLITLFVFNAVGLWRNLGMCMVKGTWATTVTPEVAAQLKGMHLGWVWSLYNLLVLGIALLILTDAPKPDRYEWFDLRRTVQITVGDRSFWGMTTMLSEGGAEIALTQIKTPACGAIAHIHIQEEQLILDASITQVTQSEDDYPRIHVQFEELSTPQYRGLVELLFCRPGQWKRPIAPGELRSFYLMVRSFLTPRILFDRQHRISPVEVAKV